MGTKICDAKICGPNIKGTKNGHKKVSNSWIIADMDKCRQDKCCIDICGYMRGNEKMFGPKNIEVKTSLAHLTHFLNFFYLSWILEHTPLSILVTPSHYLSLLLNSYKYLSQLVTVCQYLSLLASAFHFLILLVTTCQRLSLLYHW